MRANATKSQQCLAPWMQGQIAARCVHPLCENGPFFQNSLLAIKYIGDATKYTGNKSCSQPAVQPASQPTSCQQPASRPASSQSVTQPTASNQPSSQPTSPWYKHHINVVIIIVQIFNR